MVQAHRRGQSDERGAFNEGLGGPGNWYLQGKRQRKGVIVLITFLGPFPEIRFVRLLSHLAALRLLQSLNNDASSHNSIN